MSGSQLSADRFGINQMLVADPHSSEFKRFLVAHWAPKSPASARGRTSLSLKPLKD
ncbi:hypothetical protein D9M68_567210 [compost metagenome]